jgi:predicted dehydrogenase
VSKLRLGIIGCGRIVEEGHLPAWMRLKDKVSVTALSDRSRKRLELVSSMVPPDSVTCHEDFRRMVECEALDFVDISLPHYLHKDAAICAARAGLGILLEKPMAASYQDAGRVADAVEKTKVRFSLAHNYCFIPAFIAGLDAVRRGEIGKPFMMRAEVIYSGEGWKGARNGVTPDWRTRQELSGGGVLIDYGYHFLYLAKEYMGSPVKSVFAKKVCTSYAGSRASLTENIAILILTHANGSLTSIHAGTGAEKSQQIFEVHGTRGSLILDREGGNNRIVFAHGRAQPLRIPKGDPWGYDGLFRAYVNAWYRKGKMPATRADGLEIMRIIRAAYKSTKCGKEIRL